MEMVLRVVLLLTAVAAISASYYECDPFYSHSQSRFCHNSAVLGVRVLAVYRDRYDNPWEFRYRVRVFAIYKGEGDFFRGQLTWIYNNDDVFLRRNRNYVISVSYNYPDNEFYINGCGINKSYRLLTANERRGIRGEYDCRCGIKYVDSVDSKRDDECLIGDNNRQCLIRRGFCQYEEDDKCVWRGPSVEECFYLQ